jgi:hypothetical protein
MDSILTILSRKRWPLVAAFTLLLVPFMAATSYAKEVPIKISYTGTLLPIPVNLGGGPTGATMLDAQSHGSFGASMSHIITEWVPGTGSCESDYPGYDYYMLLHASVVVTFSNNDQLFGAGALWTGDTSGWMCLNSGNGHFVGVANGGFSGGTGRFEGASGTFASPFSGYNLTAFTLGYGSGPIQGSFEGTIELP